MKCPYCKATIDDDSYYCDQCGKEMRFCPDCGKPKQGTVCAACGADLVSAKDFLGGSKTDKKTPDATPPQTAQQQSQQQQPAPQPSQSQQPQGTMAAQQPQPQGTMAANPNEPSTLVGNGWRLPLKPGVFGRSGGIYPEFKTQKYISGRHGEILHNSKGQWGITDLGSTNGTFIDGTRLEPNKSYLLKKGQELTIATTKFKVE